MKTQNNNVVMQNLDIISVTLATGLILLIPFTAMQFTEEVVWTAFDFLVAGTLLLGTGLTFVLAARTAPKYRILIGLGLLMALIITWAELAVGIFGSPFAGS